MSKLITADEEYNDPPPGDSPECDVCGSITIVSGDCYKCLNCGNSMGIPPADKKTDGEKK